MIVLQNSPNCWTAQSRPTAMMLRSQANSFASRIRRAHLVFSRPLSAFLNRGELGSSDEDFDALGGFG